MITAPLVTRFSSEYMRPCADALEQAAQAVDNVLHILTIWAVWRAGV